MVISFGKIAFFGGGVRGWGRFVERKFYRRVDEDNETIEGIKTGTTVWKRSSLPELVRSQIN